MSRLDSFIRRMDTQRRLLDMAIADTKAMDGFVLELGLGNGRTYDHLREKMPERDIYVFERDVRAHPDCIPPDDRLYLGNVIEQLSHALQELGSRAVMVHSDIGTGDEEASIRFGLTELGPALEPLLAPGAMVVSDQPLGFARARELDKPADIDPDRYHLYRAT